jgi:hypothetical protein
VAAVALDSVFRESRMREICTSGSMRGQRACPLAYSTRIDFCLPRNPGSVLAEVRLASVAATVEHHVDILNIKTDSGITISLDICSEASSSS